MHYIIEFESIQLWSKLGMKDAALESLVLSYGYEDEHQDKNKD